MGLGEVFKLFATLGIDATEFDAGLAGAEQKLNATAQAFSGAGRTLTMGVTAPIVGLGTAALHSSISFESAFAGVRKTVDATEEQFAQLEQGILDMSERVPVSAAEIARVAEAAGQLGIQADDVLEFTEVMIGLGEATADMMPEEAAMQVARFMNIMQTAPGDVDRLASTIVDLGNNLAATEGEIALMGMRLAGAGNLIGLTEAEVLGLAGTMTSLGIRAEAGGTAMSRVMREIMNAVMAGGDDLETFATIAGVSAEEFAAAFNGNPIQAIQLFSDGLGRIRDEGGNVNEALEAVSMNDIRVSDALLRMSGAGDTLSESISLATNAWEENTALQEEVDRRYETTESQLRMLLNTLVKVAVTLGESLIPFLMQVVEAAKPLLEGLKNLTEWFANLDPRMQQTIVTAAGIVAAIGPLMMIIGNLAGAIESLLPIVRMIPGAFTAVRTAIGLLSGPIGWIITAVGLIAAAWSTDFMGLKTKTLEAWEAIKARFTEAWERLSTLAQRIREIVTGLLDAFRGFLNDVRGVSASIEQAFRDWWGDIWRFLSGLPGEMLNFGKDLMQGLINGVRSMMTGAVDAVRGVGENVINSFKSLLGIQSPSKVFYGFGVDIGEGLAQGIESSEGRVKEAVEGLTKRVFKASGAFDPAGLAAALTSGLAEKDAIAAIRARLSELTGQRDHVMEHYGSNRFKNVALGFINPQIEALNDELARLRQELVTTRNHTAREGEAQTRRFSMAVTTFGADVRSLTLAKQRY